MNGGTRPLPITVYHILYDIVTVKPFVTNVMLNVL